LRFNPRSRGGSDCRKRVVHWVVGVSIHAPEGGATADPFSTPPRNWRFNPRSRGGSDLGTGQQHSACAEVSIHAPEGGATRGAIPLIPAPEVSIHAPEGGATVSKPVTPLLEKVSIHAPEGGATAGSPRNPPAMQVSIHAPEGGATGHTRRDYRRGEVSIHAPEGGATAAHLQARLNGGSFNPRSRGGSDSRSSCSDARIQRFQSTLPRGERHNTTPSIVALRTVSIHAPEGGATVELYHCEGTVMFQSTLPRGERLSPAGRGGGLALFQSTLPRGERRA